MVGKDKNGTLSEPQQVELIKVLQDRFAAHPKRHPNLDWELILKRLLVNAPKLWSLHEMQRTGGEPDVVGFDEKSGEYIFMDCSAESPKGRRSVCYDRAGLESRKDHPPAHTALDMAAEMGIEVLTEEQYRFLQKVGPFDTKTSSWLLTPPDIREAGGAIFGDFRYGQVFVYHNGAQSYYAARAFRGVLFV